MGLALDSAAIDAGDDTVLNAPSNLTTDQRGFPRKIGSHVDIGAFEHDPPQPWPNFVVTTLDDHDDGAAGVLDCTLREALNAATTFGATITFAGGLEGTISLKLGELGYPSTASIIGPTDRSITINANHTSRVFHVFTALSIFPSTLTLANLAITGGQPGSYGGGIYVGFNATLNLSNCTIYGNISNDSGGGIANNGVVTMANCTVTGNQAFRAEGSSPLTARLCCGTAPSLRIP